jgi:hypothetical protein
VKWPAGLPPSRSAKIADASGRGWHSQVTFASGVSSATVRPLDSIVCRSTGTARSPNSQLRRVSSSSPRMRAASSGSATRCGALVSPGPIFTPMSGPCRLPNAFSSVTSSPK